ncbi:MAG: hypothetical protein AAGI07_16630, partial [Bacteroidota bacterium]
KIEIEDFLTGLYIMLENSEDSLLLKKRRTILNQLVGMNMVFEKLITSLSNTKEVLSKYPATFPVSSCNRCFKKHLQLEKNITHQKDRYYQLKNKVDFIMTKDKLKH